MGKISVAARKYFKEVKKHLSCSWSTKNGFISYLKDNLDYSILTDTTMTKEKLVEILGEPEAMARNFDSANQNEIRLRAKICSLSRLVIIALSVIVVLLAGILIYEILHLGGEIIIAKTK